MKYFPLATTAILFFLCSALSAQAVIKCKGDPENASITFLEQVGDEIKLKVKWDTGATFGPSGLNMTNATCESGDCPAVGGIGRATREAEWTLKMQNPQAPVMLTWGGNEGNRAFCENGDDQLLVGGLQLGCAGTHGRARITVISKVGQTIKVQVDWSEGATFMGSYHMDMTNATCTQCERVGGIGLPHGTRKIMILTQNDPNQDVVIKWGGNAGNIAFCGADKYLTIPAHFTLAPAN